MFKITFIKTFKNPLMWMPGLITPIAMAFFYSDLMSCIVLGAIMLIINPVATSLIIDKEQKRIKHYLIIKNGLSSYFITQFLINLIFFYIDVALIMLINIVMRHNYDAVNLLSSLLFSFFAFCFGFGIGWFLGSMLPSTKILSVTMVVFLAFLGWTSGIFWPQYFLGSSLGFVLLFNPFASLNVLTIFIQGRSILNPALSAVWIMLLITWMLLLTFFIYHSFKNIRN